MLILYPAAWEIPELDRAAAMSYADAQGSGHHAFADYERFLCLPVQWPSIAPSEGRFRMLIEFERCLLEGAQVLVLVPEAGPSPPEHLGDDEPFNSTRQFLRQVTGGLKGAILDEIPDERRAQVRVREHAPPRFKSHLLAHTPHYLTRFAHGILAPMAVCGRVRGRASVVAAAYGEGRWSAIPWIASAFDEPAWASVSPLFNELDEFAVSDGPAPASSAGIQFPEGTTWSDLRLSFTDDHTVRVSLRGGRQTWSVAFWELGMADGRSKRPDSQWETLIALADASRSPRRSPIQPHRVRRLRQALRSYFDLEGDPIPNTFGGDGWIPRFELRR